MRPRSQLAAGAIPFFLKAEGAPPVTHVVEGAFSSVELSPFTALSLRSK
jgi:hypothetical protein